MAFDNEDSPTAVTQRVKATAASADAVYVLNHG